MFNSMILVVLAVYYIQTVGMNPLQLVLAGTVFELTIFLFEIPTGVIADTYSRRLSVIIGFALIGIAYLFEGWVPVYTAILAAEVVAGVGDTFISGAASAWLADEVGEERAGPLYMRYAQVSQIGSFAGIAAGTALAALQLNLPIYLAGALIVGLSLFLLAAMPEQGFRPAPHDERGSWRALLATTRAGLRAVRVQPILWMFLLVAVAFGAFGEGLDRLWEAHFLDNFSFPAWGNLPPVVWIGLIHGGAMLLSLVVSEALIRRLDLGNPTILGRVLLATTALLIGATLLFGLAGAFAVAVLAYWSAAALRAVQTPIATAWLNRHIDSRVRATVLSTIGQAGSLGEVGGGVVVGAVALRSLRAALVFGAILLTPALALFARKRRAEENVQPEIAIAEEKETTSTA
jgi:DHA3 family tetracycline resistance protein-like MFS transporter